ncbi:MAG: hypothetical protein ABIP39_04305 [Polyangiaceae bacterium]
MSALDASITLEEVFAVVSTKRVPLAPELAGYLTLEITEGAGGGLGEVDPKHVYIGDEGSVALVRPKRDNPAGDAESSIRAILQKLLDASGSQTPALGAAAKRASGGGVPLLSQELEAALIPVNRAAGRRALARLAREVKRVTMGVGRNASVPASERGPRASSPSFDRSVVPAANGGASAAAPAPTPATIATPVPPALARPVTPPPVVFGEEEQPTTARRDIPSEILDAASPKPSLARPMSVNDLPTREFTSMEAVRAKGRDEVDSLLSAFEVSENRPDLAVSRDLKAMAGLDPTPPPPDSDGIESLLAMTGRAPEARRAPSEPPKATQSRPDLLKDTPLPARRRSPSYADDRQLPTAPAARKPSLAPPAPAPRRRAPKTDRFLIALLLLLVGAGAVIVWMLKPGFFTGRTPDAVRAEKVSVEAERAKIEAAAKVQACKATLTVFDVPADAEVLLRVGQAPVDVEHMPIGARLEFVATADGYAPKRVVVPQGATWDPGPGGKARFEVAVQLDPSKGKAGSVDAWPPGEPGSEVGGKGAPGTVHVVATPKGAELWLLTGLGPEAVIEQLPCQGDVDVLVAGPKGRRTRLHVKEADFAANPGHAAKVSAK